MKVDIEEVSHLEPTNVRRHHKKLIRSGDLAPDICALLISKK